MTGERSPLDVGFSDCFTTSAPAFLASCSVTTEVSLNRSNVYFSDNLVQTIQHELQPLDRYVDGSENGGDDKLVVLGTKLDEFDGNFEVVQEATDVGQE